MGCWNGTCLLSQTAIRAGQKVKAVITVGNLYNEGNNFCYSGGVYSPMTFLLDAKYDDYGGIEEVENNISARLFVKYFKEKVQQGIFTVKEDSHYQVGDTVEEIATVIERGLVTAKERTYRGQESEQSVVLNMINADIFNSVVDKSSYITDCTYAVEDLFINPVVSDRDKIFKEMIEELEKEFEESESEELKEKITSMKRLLGGGPSDWASSEIRKEGKWGSSVRILDSMDYVHTDSMRSYAEIIKEEINKEDYQDAVDMLAEFISLLHTMSSLRKAWNVQVGAGSQQESGFNDIKLAKAIIKESLRQLGMDDDSTFYTYYDKELDTIEYAEDTEFKISRVNLNEETVDIVAVETGVKHTLSFDELNDFRG